MTARVLYGDALVTLPTIDAGSAQCCVTSPPYWGLRSYLPADHPLKHLEIGAEKTPGEYIEKLVAIFQDSAPRTARRRRTLAESRRQLRR